MICIEGFSLPVEISPEFLDNSCYLCIWSVSKKMFMKLP